MKRSLLVCSLCFWCLLSSAQWHTVYKGSDTANAITGVSFYTPSAGYVASRKWAGFTADTGRSVSKKYVTNSNVDFGFASVNLTFGFDIHGVQAFSADTVLVYGDYGLEPSILYSVNGGNSWKLVYHKNIRSNAASVVNTLADMAFPGNGTIGYGVQGDEIVKSTDRGATWQTNVYLPDQQLFRLSMVSSSLGYAAGPGGIFKTTNEGVNWGRLFNSPPQITAISAAGSNSLFVSSNGNTFYSSNGGSDFTQTNITEKFSAVDMVFTNDSTGYAIEGGFYIWQTRNRGQLWELMPGSNTFSYLFFGYNRLYFYNSSLAWACGAFEYLANTANSGGVTLPKALYHYDISTTCATGQVQLVNEGYLNYTYRWLRNGVQFSTGFNASYAANDTTDFIQLIATKGAYSDTLSNYIIAYTSKPLTLDVRPIKDTFCSNGPVTFEIKNSRTTARYQAGRSCCLSGSPVAGNGGTITVSIDANSNEDSVSTFTISAVDNGQCGLQTAQAKIPVQLINIFPATTAISDTICTQKVFNITIPASRPGYLYWADTLVGVVKGTGSDIQVPATLQDIKSSYVQDFDGLLITYGFDLYTKHEQSGCFYDFPIATVNMIARRTIASFVTNSHEVLTGQTISLTDKSRQATDYRWSFGTGASVAESPSPNTSVSYNQTGIRSVILKTTTKEGCVDSANRYIEVYDSPGVNDLAACAGIGGSQGIADSIRTPDYYVSRAFYEDEYGSRVVAGGSISMKYPNQFYPRGNEGFFARKYTKAGKLLWSLKNNGYNSYQYSRNSHIILEQAIGDHAGNTYLLGHALNQFTITDSTNTFTIPQATGLFMKVDSTGKIVWLRSLYNKDITGLNIVQDYSGGSLLRGKNDAIYVVTHRVGASSLYNFMSGDDLVATGTETNTGVIIQYDSSGNILRKKTFPITGNNLRRYEIYTSDSYDRMPPATWDSSGHLVIFGKLNTSEMTGNTIDNYTIPFNTNEVKDALLFVDTTSLLVVAVKPIALQPQQAIQDLTIDSYCMDTSGNYYAGFTGRAFFPQSSQSYQNDTLKYKSFIVAYNTTGHTSWTKETEGLQPLAMLAYDKGIKVYGTNYIGSGYTNSGQKFSSNASPTTGDIKKLSIITDPGGYSGQGRVGLGSLDNVIASLQPATGNMLSIISLGTAKEDEPGTMRVGYGGQFWATGTAGLTLRNAPAIIDTASTLFTYKFPVTDNCQLLPVTLSYFTASCSQQQVVYAWQTLTELNTSAFTIQKSSDGVTWQGIATIPAKGLSTIALDYRFTAPADYTAQYYRLRQADKDGHITYSSIAHTNCLSQATSLRAYPNPVSNILSLRIATPVAHTAALQVFDSKGQLLQQNRIALLSGTNFQRIDMTGLPGGVYRIVMSAAGFSTISSNILKQ